MSRAASEEARWLDNKGGQEVKRTCGDTDLVIIEARAGGARHVYRYGSWKIRCESLTDQVSIGHVLSHLMSGAMDAVEDFIICLALALDTVMERV